MQVFDAEKVGNCCSWDGCDETWDEDVGMPVDWLVLCEIDLTSGLHKPGQDITLCFEHKIDFIDLLALPPEAKA